jgi:hypothetical protein
MFPAVSTVMLVVPPWLLYFTPWYELTLRSDVFNELLHVESTVSSTRKSSRSGRPARRTRSIRGAGDMRSWWETNPILSKRYGRGTYVPLTRRMSDLRLA